MQNKRYYWLKLKNDFFEGDEINWLEEQENGAVYILFYLKLCLWSLRSDGVLMRRVGKMEIPYDTKSWRRSRERRCRLPKPPWHC